VFRKINLDIHGLIEASAGTGKTYTIERLVLRLLAEKKVPLENILVVTFTEAAAMELRSRIRGLLEHACANGGIDGYDIAADKIEILRGELLAFDRAGIYTIHGFCNRALARWPLETGLARGGEIVDEASLAGELVAEEMRGAWGQWDSVLQGALTREISRTGLEKFRNTVCAVAQKYVPGQVDLAPEASDGLDAYCASEKAFRERVETVTKDLRNKAGELLDEYKNVKSLLRPAATKEEKFNAITTWLEGFAGRATGVEDQVAANEEKKETARQWFGFTDPDMRVQKVAAFYERWTEFIGEKTGICAEISARKNSLTASLGVGLRRRLDSHRISKGMISYNDMIRAVERGLAQKSTALCDRLRGQYRYGIIDEFQDTNALQWNIFRRVFMEGGDGRLFVVGDPKQSIFRVQDADVYTYLEARSCYEEKRGRGEAGIYPLDVNHRSTGGLIDACNGFFSKNNWFDVEGISFKETRRELKNIGVAKAAPAADKDDAHVKSIAETLKPLGPVVLRPLYGMPEIAVGRNGNPYVASQRLSYAKYIVAKIIEWHAQGLPYGSMALLYETRAYAGPLLPLLSDAGIPYTQYKETGLFSSSEALNWACLLEFLAESTPQNYSRLLLTDFFGQDPSGVVAGMSAERFESIAEEWRGLAGHRQWPGLMRAVLSDTALLCRAARQAGGKRVIAAYRQIGEWTAARLIADHMPPRDIAKRLRAFHSGARPPAEEEDRFRRETEEDAVRATTIHSSKGLEFDVVFVLGGYGEKKTPAAPFVVRAENGKRREKILVSLDSAHAAAMAAEDECERRRLLYVGLTRARYKMVLPSWLECKPDKKTSVLQYDKLPAYEKNLLDAAAAQEVLFNKDTAPAQRVASVQEQHNIYQRPRAEAFTSADNGPARSAGIELAAYAAQCGIAGRRALLHSYSSIVHRERDSGLEWKDDAHDSANGLAANLPKQLRLDPEAVLHAQPAVPHAPPLALAGKKTGSALHEVLEDLDFADVNSDGGGLLRKIENRFGAYGLLERSPEKRAETCRQVAGLLRAALNLRLPLVGGGSLSPVEISKKDFLAESFFSAAVGRESGLLGAKPEGTGAADSVIGFIDVIFRKGNDIYLLDWKSDTLDAYDRKTICDAMHGGGYTVQAALYAAAYQRWLSTRFGALGYALRGICYVFLRGPAAVTIPVDDKVIGAWSEGLRECFVEAARDKLMLTGSAG
jgi:exodeoxyribonuclease V beta subunit